MVSERASYLVYIQRSETITLQLQDIKSDLKQTVDFIAQIENLNPVVSSPSLQQLTPNDIIKHHSDDLLVVR